ncbi:endonuclease [Thiosulfatimonas sediminis]|uniref:Endonuclease n=1 Tax=Thiosulfatimonas sediminis TaxID=2675054 RepID=A0A6F8PSJ1_9GAMM|nr:YqaJ viral recombinase family protein [Thiosulfatimonas sediminis]BBP45102.1 endonuclease [Thiosulfatimonas sediminis]
MAHAELRQHPQNQPVTSSTQDLPIADTQRKFAQAYRMIATNQLDKHLWLKYRGLGIGASDAAAACGLNPFKSQLELWMEKTGRIEPSQPSDNEDSPLLWGTVLEPIVAEHYAKRTGSKVRRVNAILQHADYPWMLANLDREVQGGEVPLLECKTTGAYGAKHWSEGVPEYVQLQVQHQLAVTGFEAADVAVLIAGQELQIHRIERDEDLISNLIALEQAFWHRVTEDIPPPADASASSERALRQLYPQNTSQTLNLTENKSANTQFEELLYVREQLAILSDKEALLKHQLQQTLGDAEQAQFESGRISWKCSKPSTAFDSKAFKEDHPDLYAEYQIPKMGSRRFLVKPD